MIRDQETLDILLNSINNFVKNELQPIEEEVADNDEVPKAVIQKMRDMGLFGFALPEEYGGFGATMEEEVLICIALGHTSPAFRSLVGTNNGIGGQGIVIDGTEQQQNSYLPKLASGEIIGSFCLTEPEAGSDAASLKTTAIRDGDYYIVNGTKRFITNAPHADIFTVMARTNPEIKGAAGISAFIVEKNTAGLTIGKPDKKMGQQGSHTADVIFDSCRIPASQLIGGIENIGFKTAMKVLDKGRLSIAATCVGVAERMLKEALKYAMERKQFGKRIADFEMIQSMLAESKAEIYAAKCMVIDGARRKDEGHNVISEASCAKMFASEMCGRVADRAVQIFGGAGYIKDYGIERFYRDVRLFRIYEGTTQIQQIVIAKSMIKEAEND